MLSQEQKTIRIIEKTVPAVVSIVAHKKLKDIQRQRPGWLFPIFDRDKQFNDVLRRNTVGNDVRFGGGSGFIVDSSGIIATNMHVILQRHLDYEVTLSGGKKYPARLIAADEINDIAFLKINADARFPTLVMGDSARIKLGQNVLAIGNALGLFRNTVSAGIISGLARTIEANSELVRENLHDLIQTDAAINPGNSGGPLLDMAGNAVGINIASVIAAENIGFAIPINKIKTDLEQIKKYGKITKPFLGVRYVMLNDAIRDMARASVNYGALVVSPSPLHEAVIKNSPAARAGIRAGDVLIEADGHKLTPQFTLQDFLDTAKIGQQIELKVMRKNKTIEYRVSLQERKWE